MVRGCVSGPAGEGKSQNLTVAVHINGISVSPHLDTQANVTVGIEKHYVKLQVSFSLQCTSVTIRSYSGEGKGWSLRLQGTFTATLSRGEGEMAEPVYVVKDQGTVLLSHGAVEQMGFVEYYLDLTSSTPLPVIGESQQAKVDQVEEYKEATRHESRHNRHRAGTEEYL